MQFEDAKDTKSELRVRGAALRHARKIGSVILSDEYFRLWQGAQAEFAAYADGITTLLGARPRLTLRPARRGDGFRGTVLLTRRGDGVRAGMPSTRFRSRRRGEQGPPDPPPLV